MMSANIYGVDLGTANLKIYCKASGTILNEKNTIAIINKNQMYAYGDSAYAMYEKAPDQISVTFPIVNGVIADYNNMQAMLFEFLEKNTKGKTRGAEFVVAVPTDITKVEKKAFSDILYKSKAKPKNVLLCEKPIANAVGLGLNVNEPTGIMIVDIGADTTEISILSLGGLVLSHLLHFGGNRLDESIISFIRKNYNLVIGRKTACKEELASALEGRDASMTIVGRDVVSGLPIEMEITASIVYEAIRDHLTNICTNIKLILEKTPPELAKDIIYSGIYITGGSSKIERLDELFTKITNIKVNCCDNPEESVAQGLIKIVSDNEYKHLAYNLKTSEYL